MQIFCSRTTHTLAEGELQPGDNLNIDTKPLGFAEVVYAAWQVCAAAALLCYMSPS